MQSDQSVPILRRSRRLRKRVSYDTEQSIDAMTKSAADEERASAAGPCPTTVESVCSLTHCAAELPKAQQEKAAHESRKRMKAYRARQGAKIVAEDTELQQLEESIENQRQALTFLREKLRLCRSTAKKWELEGEIMSRDHPHPVPSEEAMSGDRCLSFGDESEGSCVGDRLRKSNAGGNSQSDQCNVLESDQPDERLSRAERKRWNSRRTSRAYEARQRVKREARQAELSRLFSLAFSQGSLIVDLKSQIASYEAVFEANDRAMKGNAQMAAMETGGTMEETGLGAEYDSIPHEDGCGSSGEYGQESGRSSY